MIPVDVSGRIDYDLMEAAVRENTRRLSSHASKPDRKYHGSCAGVRNCGTPFPLLIVDAAQTAGILPINVQKSGIDVLCFFRPQGMWGRGTGGIYVRPELSIRPLKMGGSGIKAMKKEQPAAMPEHLEAGNFKCPRNCGTSGSAGISGEDGD